MIKRQSFEAQCKAAIVKINRNRTFLLHKVVYLLLFMHSVFFTSSFPLAASRSIVRGQLQFYRIRSAIAHPTENLHTCRSEEGQLVIG
jgi:hypothetical protein